MWIFFGLPMLLALALYVAGIGIIAKDVVSQWGTLDGRQRRHLLIAFLSIGVFLFGMANFGTFWIVTMTIGGSADKVENGHYYVSNHGRFTEVSPAAWSFVYYLERSLWITHPLTVLAIFYIAFSQRNAPTLSFSIVVARDGTIRVNGQANSMDEVINMAKVASSLRQHVYLKHECSFHEVPSAGVKLWHELTESGVLFEAIYQTDATTPA
jgi:hypothetical protein